MTAISLRRVTLKPSRVRAGARLKQNALYEIWFWGQAKQRHLELISDFWASWVTWTATFVPLVSYHENLLEEKPNVSDPEHPREASSTLIVFFPLLFLELRPLGET